MSQVKTYLVDDEDVKGMSEEEKEKYIDQQIYEHLIDTLEWGYKIKE